MTLYREFGCVFPVEVIGTVETSIWVIFSPSRGIFDLQRHVAPPEGGNVVWRMKGGSQVAACARISQVPREHHLFSYSRGTHTSEVTAPSHILQRIRSRPLPRDEIPLERVFYPRQDENLDGGFF